MIDQHFCPTAIKLFSLAKNASLLLSSLGLFMASSALAQQQNSMHFVVVGDMPYSEAESQRLSGEIAEAIRASGVPFVVHCGDLKSGKETCTKELLTQRRDAVYSLMPGRVFYTPGDNDWTDCDRPILQPAVSELVSMDFLRQLFFASPLELPASWHYARQANFPENARWMQDGVFFMTVHLVATSNGRKEIFQDDVEAALTLVDARDQAARVWMQESFAAALEVDAKAMVVAIQADVTAPDAGGPCTGDNRMHCDAFLNFRENLRLNARNFVRQGKERMPVLLIHGDTSPYCLDKKFGGQQAPNLWRLNVWGDFRSPADATLIAVSPADRQNPFAAQTLLGREAPEEECE